MTDRKQIRRITLSGLFIALGIYLPFLTGQVPPMGNKLLPMHLPVLLSGFVCGPFYGLLVGFIVPLLRSMIYTTPPFPIAAVPMAFELAAYGFLTGFFHKLLPKNRGSILLSLLLAMVGGRAVWGLVRFVMLFSGTPITWEIYFASVFLQAIPGIIIQLLLIPLLISTLQRAGLVSGE